jgi:flagellar biogenesis protein FliO
MMPAAVLMVAWALLILALLGIGVWGVFRVTSRRRPARRRSR